MDRYVFNVGLFLLCLLCFGVGPIQAFDSSVFLSELYPAPYPNETEWIEIYNPGLETATISGWVIKDQLSTPSVLFTIDYLELAASSTHIIELTEPKLNNSGDTVVIETSEGTIIDSFSYSSTTQGKSWHRAAVTGEPFVDDPTKNFFSSAPTPIPTPTKSLTLSPLPSVSENTPTPTLYTLEEALLNLQVTEVLACPYSGEVEWIELYNPENSKITIDKLDLIDRVGNQRSFSSLTVPGNSYTVIEWDVPFLNNAGDTLRVFINSNELTEIELPPCLSGQSFSLVDSGYMLTELATPGLANELIFEEKTAAVVSSTATIAPSNPEPIMPTLSQSNLIVSSIPTYTVESLTVATEAAKVLDQANANQTLALPFLIAIISAVSSITTATGFLYVS